MAIMLQKKRVRSNLVTIAALVIVICLIQFWLRRKHESVGHSVSVDSGTVQRIGRITTTAQSLCIRSDELLSSELEDGKIRELSANLQVYSALTQEYYSRRLWFSTKDNCLKTQIARMERRLFPWLNQNVTMHTLPKTFRGRGIVIAAGFWQLRSAYVTIKSIREALGSSLPIEIFYNGDEELPEQSADELLKFPFVKLINLATYIDTHVTSSWGVKPFALLFSSFKESIIIDADSMFLRDPEELFSFSGYARTGSLLFRDRTVSGSTVEGKNWIGKILTQPSAYALKHNRIYTGDSIHEGESGVVVMHKGKKANFDALVLTALMNSVAHRNELWQIFYGDKESWWLAHELMHAPYHLANGGGGAIGYTAFENNSTYVCGGLLHVDEAWRPFWFNGGVIANKHFEDGKQVLINYTHWMTDPDYKDVQWIWEEKDKPFCMKERQGREVYGLTEGQMGIAEGLVRAWEGATHIHV